MKKSCLGLLSCVILSLTGCALKVGNSFEDYPPIASGQGQLVIFSVPDSDSKLRFRGEIECNGQLCANVLNGSSPKGVYSVYTLTPREVKIKAPGKKWIAFAGNVELLSNTLTVKIESNVRKVVMVTLLEGSEVRNGAGAVGNATQRYRIEAVSEPEGLAKIKGLTELQFKDVFK